MEIRGAATVDIYCMPSKSKTKGSGWELEIAKFLSALYNESFLRAPSSGAYIGGKNTARKEFLHENQIRSFKGDIIPGESFPRFNAEAKFYADFPFHQLFQGEVKILEGWIAQCLDVADPGDFNIMFLKFNRKGKWVAFEAQHLDTIQVDRHFVYHSKLGDWVLMDFTDFWQKNSSAVKNLCK